MYGSISGTVTDSQGAVIPKANVTITSIERNSTDVVETNESGLFVKDRLLPGTYKVTIEAPGDKQGLVSSVVVNVDTQAKTDVTLEAGQVTETVTISDTEGQLLKTDRADVSTTFEKKTNYRSPDSRPQLHKIHTSDSGNGTESVAARRQ